VDTHGGGARQPQNPTSKSIARICLRLLLAALRGMGGNQQKQA